MQSAVTPVSLWRVTVVMLLVQAAGSLAVFGAGVLAPQVAADIGVPATRVGLFNAIVYVFAMCSGAATALIQDRSGPVTALIVALAMLILGLVCGVAGHWLVIMGAAAAFGMAYGPMNPATSHILAEITPPSWRTFIFSLKQTGVTLGGALAGVLLPPIMLSFGWRSALWLQVVLVVIVIALLIPLIKHYDFKDNDKVDAHNRSWRRSMAMVGSSRVMRCLAAVSFIFAGMQISVGAFFVLYVVVDLQVDLLTAGYLFSVMQIGGVVGRLIWGYLASRLLTPVNALMAIALISSLLIVCLVLVQPHWPLWLIGLLAFVLGTTGYGWNGVVLSEIARFAPHGRVTDAVGAVQFVFFFGVVIMPPVFGQIVEWGGSYRTAFVLLALIGGIALGLLARFRRLLIGNDLGEAS